MDYKCLKIVGILTCLQIGIAIRVHYGIRVNRINPRHKYYKRLISRHSSLSHHICNSIQNLGPFLKNLCVERTDLYLAVNKGLADGVKTCQKMFENDRWNCTTKGKPESGILGIVMARVSREASFMYAAVSAGITHGVTKDCSLGGIRNCGCEKVASLGANGNQVKWECDPDVAIRTKISRSVIEDGLLKWDAEALMNRHNSDIGRRAVKEHQSLQCKCFGLSGVCTSKTCHRALLPRMETIGMWLKHKYGQAVHVKPSRRRNRSGYPRFLVQKNGRGRPNMNNLIYLEDSPTYCERDWSTGSLGTKGRRCNITVAGESNSCQLLCCGRGYDTRIQTIKRMCNCKFRWCCEVECDECRNTCRVYTCK